MCTLDSLGLLMLFLDLDASLGASMDAGSYKINFYKFVVYRIKCIIFE